MTTPADMHPLAETYVNELTRAARRLPRGQRTELIAEIRAHLAEAAPLGASHAEVLTALERLGEPADILGEPGDGSLPPSPRLAFHELAAILLLMFGGFLVFVGWLAGVFMLWTSDRWTLRDKLIGTLVIPGGYATAAYTLLAVSSVQECGGTAGHVTCTDGPTTLGTIGQIALSVFVFAGPLAAAFYLTARARQRS